MIQVYPIAVLTGPTCSGKTKLAISVSRAAGAVLLPLDQLHRYAHLREGTGLDFHLIDEVVHDGYAVLSPWEVSGPSKYGDWLRLAILHYAKKRPIVIEGGCSSYLREVLQRICTDSVFRTARVFALDDNLTESEARAHIASICSQERCYRIVTEVERLVHLGFLNNEGLPFLKRCEQIFVHPEHVDQNLAWAIRISANVYCPAFLALLGHIDLNSARARIISNAVDIYCYQAKRIRGLLDEHELYSTYSDKRIALEAILDFLFMGCKGFVEPTSSVYATLTLDNIQEKLT